MDEQIIQLNLPSPAHVRSENAVGNSDALEFPLPLPAGARFGRSDRLAALVSSSNEIIQQRLADWVAEGYITVFRAFTVGESRRILSSIRVGLIVTDDRLVDGGYEDILDTANRLELRAPMIVVSPTGDWPEYLRAMERGVFDYLAYPPLSPDFSRVIRQALASPASILGRMRSIGGGQ